LLLVFTLHRAWLVAAVTFVALVGAAGFRATPGVLMNPLHDEFGWSMGTISAAVSVNLALFGLTSPFAAALMERFGIRRVVSVALLVVAAGSGLTVFMTSSWQLILCWGVLVGLGTGSMALAFVATVTSAWFVKHRGIVTGVLTAGSAAGQLVFLPVLASIAGSVGWRAAALTVAGAALVVVPLVAWLLRDRPEDVGLLALGATKPSVRPVITVSAGRRAVEVLVAAARTRNFWLLAAGFAICGATTNGLVGTHFIPAAMDHGMGETAAASLLALVGVFDIVGTIFSGWLTDRLDSRVLLGAYYGLRGLSLFALPSLFAGSTHPSMLVFIVFYGLDWVATVPPTVALCRKYYGVSTGPIVFGWVFASHQVGAAFAAVAAGIVRDQLGNYDLAWYIAGILSCGAAVLSLLMLATRRRVTAPEPALAA
jgi:sugar phosphate permease